MKRLFLTAAALAAVSQLPAALADGKASRLSDDQQIAGILSDIEKGWENGDAEPFRQHFLDFPGARYFESGRENSGLADLIDHHVVPEGSSIPDLLLDFSNVQIFYEGSFAWVVSDTVIEGTIAKTGDKLDGTGKETLLLRKSGEQWKVVHTHSSSRAKKN